MNTKHLLSISLVMCSCALRAAEPGSNTNQPATARGEITLPLTNRYLHVPIVVQTNRPVISVRVGAHDLGVYETTRKLPKCDVAWMDLGSFVRPGATVTISGLQRDLDGISLDAERKGTAPAYLGSQAAMKIMKPTGVKMLHTPSTGRMWDPSLLWHDGWYWLYAMHNATGVRNADYGMWGARSRDGVHWEELGAVITNTPFKLWKMFVMHNGTDFICAHGSSQKGDTRNDRQNHWKSRDGVHWEYLGKETDTIPDPRWYNPGGRWDCMYMMPKKNFTPGSANATGWWGIMCASPAQKGHGGFGLLESEDSIHWKSLPPPPFEWQGALAQGSEFTGVEKIGGRYYTIGGQFDYYDMILYNTVTFSSDSFDGPYRPDKQAFRLCGGSGPSPAHPQWLAAFGRGKKKEILISNYVGSSGWGSDVTLLPIREAVVDKQGHLRCGYWRNNELAKGDKVKLESKVRVSAGAERKVALLEPTFDFKPGVIIEGVIQAKATTKNLADSFAGFALPHQQAGQSTIFLMGLGQPDTRQSYIGLERDFGDAKRVDVLDFVAGSELYRKAGMGVANVTGLSDGRKHTFRLWIRQGLFELYVDDVLMQTFFTGPASGKLGWLAENADVSVTKLRAWRMNLE